ncbi:hypothetical protein [Dokdonia sp.]|uniref:hypothetical protein n=1 Tax=Dokdonia sp. TaxID=2024995 RepID=UPI0032645549
MKKLLKLGEALTRAQQKEIKGGDFGISDGECTTGGSCDPYGNGSDCPDLDHYCVGTTTTIIGFQRPREVFTAGICTCN